MLFEVTDENFAEEVAASPLPCVILFTAGWCTYCDEMVPAMEALSESFEGRVKFCLVNVDEQRGLRIKFAVASLPYVVYVHDGMKTPLFDAITNERRLEERINHMLAGKDAPGTMPLI